MARRCRDRWTRGPAPSPPQAAHGGPVFDLSAPDPVLAWLQFPDRALESFHGRRTDREFAEVDWNDERPPRAPEGTRGGLVAPAMELLAEVGANSAV